MSNTSGPTDDELAAFVVRSNQIEDINAREGPELEDHLATAAWVRGATDPNQAHLTPKAIHHRLMERLLPTAGEYRTVPVGLVNLSDPTTKMQPTPRARAIPQLMCCYRQSVQGLLAKVQAGAITGVMLEEALDTRFFEGLCIHPFADGNGRTFRLFHAHLRQWCGLPWRTFAPAEWSRYLTRLRRYEQQVFIPQHRQFYDELSS